MQKWRAGKHLDRGKPQGKHRRGNGTQKLIEIVIHSRWKERATVWVSQPETRLNRSPKYNCIKRRKATSVYPTSEEEVSLCGLLSLLQTGVEQAQELQDPLFSARLGQASIVHHQVRVDLAIVPAYIETSGCCIVFLNNLHSGHEPGDNIEITEYSLKPFHFTC